MKEFMDKITAWCSYFDTETFLVLAVVLAGVAFLMIVVSRLIGGKESSFDATLGTAIAVLMIYLTCIAYYAAEGHYNVLFNSLPLLNFSGDYVTIFSFKGAGIDVVCSQLVNMMLLSFLVGLVDDIIPRGSNFILWVFFRYVTAVLGVAAHAIVTYLFETYMPGVLVTYAPVIVLIVIVALLALYVFKWLIGLILGVTLSPVIGAIYTFFISNVIGKRITKAVLTTFLLALVVMILDHFQFTQFYIYSAALVSFVPAAFLILIIVYIVTKIL